MQVMPMCIYNLFVYVNIWEVIKSLERRAEEYRKKKKPRIHKEI